MLQHLIVLHIIFACMESNDSTVCIQRLHHRANEVDGIIYGEDRAMAISAAMVPKKAEDDVDMLPTVVLPDDGRFIDILGKRLSSNASSHPGFFLVLNMFPKTFDCWTFEAYLPTCSNCCFWRLFQQYACLCFCISFRMCPHSAQLGNWKRAQLVKMYSSGCQPLTTCNLPKKEAFANGTWGCKTSRGTAGTVTSFGPQGELKCLESQKHLGNNGNIKRVPIICHQRTSESNLKWRLLVECLHDFIHLSLVDRMLLAEMDLMVCFSHLFLVNSPDRGPRFLGPSFSAIQNSLAVWPPRARCQGGETGSCRSSVLTHWSLEAGEKPLFV